MLHYAVVFFVIALIAALFGFGGIAAGAAGIAKILFVVFIIRFPAGLLLYWITTNLWTVAQQYIVKRTVGPLHPVTAGAGAGGSGSGGKKAAPTGAVEPAIFFRENVMVSPRSTS